MDRPAVKAQAARRVRRLFQAGSVLVVFSPLPEFEALAFLRNLFSLNIFYFLMYHLVHVPCGLTDVQETHFLQEVGHGSTSSSKVCLQVAREQESQRRGQAARAPEPPWAARGLLCTGPLRASARLPHRVRVRIR